MTASKRPLSSYQREALASVAQGDLTRHTDHWIRDQHIHRHAVVHSLAKRGLVAYRAKRTIARITESGRRAAVQ